MKNIAEFRIIGRIGKVEIKGRVAFVEVAANYGRKIDTGWEDDTHWNRLFGKNIERAQKLGKGDLAHFAGRVRQSRYERGGTTHYGVDLIAERFAVIAANGKPADEGHDEAGE